MAFQLLNLRRPNLHVTQATGWEASALTSALSCCPMAIINVNWPHYRVSKADVRVLAFRVLYAHILNPDFYLIIFFVQYQIWI